MLSKKLLIMATSAVECPNPRIVHGYTELSPPARDDEEYLIGSISQLSKKYNETLQVE